MGHGPGGGGRWLGSASFGSSVGAHGTGGPSLKAMTASVLAARGAHGSRVSMLLFHIKTVCKASSV